MMSILITFLMIVMAGVCVIFVRIKGTEKSAWIIGSCIEVIFVEGLFVGVILDIEILGMLSAVSMMIWLLPCAFMATIGKYTDELRAKEIKIHGKSQ